MRAAQALEWGMAVKIGVARETAAGERRTALTPETCRNAPLPTLSTPCSSSARSRAPVSGKVTVRASSAKRKSDSTV